MNTASPTLEWKLEFANSTNCQKYLICLLIDGRVLAVEYKGSHLAGSDDSNEKRAIGAVWESRSQGKCLFIMPKGNDLAAIAKKVSG